MNAAVLPTVRDVITSAEVIVCCGSGGVGKTTIAAIIGLELARSGRRVVVITIDPAKRLADALGVADGLGNEPVRIATNPGERSGDRSGSGELWAAMLDPAATFDMLVHQTAPSPERAERILSNRFYRNIAGALSGTQEYMAAERLYALHDDPRFDAVVVDTPPSQHALDFIDAPGTLARFLDHAVFKLMMVPARRGLRVLNVAAQPVLRSIGKVVGGDVLADAIGFFQAFEGMESGFRDRAVAVTALLRSEQTRFVLVASPKRDTIDEAAFLAARLGDSALAVDALIVNRSTPVFARPRAARKKADAALWENFTELTALAESERAQVQPFVEQLARQDAGHTAGADAEPVEGQGDPVALAWVPLLGDDIHDLDALEQIRGLLFGTTAPAG